MIVLASTHARVCKERDRASNTADYWLDVANARTATIAGLREDIRRLQVQLRNTEAALEVFTGERQRDAKGHFVSSKVRS